MAEKIGLSNAVKEIKLGKSFMKGDHPCFHTFRYDFMPASLDTTKRATIDIGEGHQVTVTVPHIEGAGTSNTVFKGSKKPYQKECVLIIDHNTGEITLEKLTYNVQLKKTRPESSSKMRSNTPIDNSFTNKKSPAQKLSPQRKPNSSSLGRSSPIQKCSPLPKSPISNNQSSPSNGSGSTVPSMPSLSMFNSKPPPPPPVFTETVADNAPLKQGALDEPEIGVLSSSSSDSSSSGDSSDSSSSDNEEEGEAKPPPSIGSNGVSGSSSWAMKDYSSAAPAPSTSSAPAFSMPSATSLSSMPKFSQLSEDLKLSESDSDSDG